MRNDEKTLIKGMLNGNRVSLSKLISVVESDPSAISRIIESIKEIPNKVCVIGITGPPGAGKSTVTNRIIKIFREKGSRVGIIAVDPSSPFTGGAVLGDRIRMQDHALDNEVFIRSIGSRGDLGGLSNSASGIIRLFDIFTETDEPKSSLIAHELQEVFPYVVNGKKDEIKEDGNPKIQSINTLGLISYLVKAVQELSAKVTALENN